MDVSIIIVTYNTLQMTMECIDSIFSKTKKVDFEIILVDNASTDGSKEVFEKDSRITYIYSKENLGFGIANNLGFEKSNGDYIFLLNSDTLLLNNAVYEFVKYMESVDKSIGCLGCQLVDVNNRPMHSAGKFPQILEFWQRIMHFVFYELYHKYGDNEIPFSGITNVDYITGADLFLRRNVIEECGLFDPDFFMYFEETEMQYRYALAGYRRQIIITPKIKHLAGASFKRKGHSIAGVIREMHSRYVYCSKVMTPSHYHIIAAFHLLMIPRVLISRAPWNEKIELTKLIIKKL